jgi:acetyl-CoA carboxylase biotin carboxyl carrier protein
MSDFEKIEQMVEFMNAHGLSEFELEEDGRRVRLRKAQYIGENLSKAPGGATIEDSIVSSESMPLKGTDEDGGLVVVKSPIVGTFYRAPDPDADPFVEVGVSIKKGQVLCIIEAMKLMNEIDAEEAGEVLSIFVENGQAVQYGDKLFAIKPS